MIRKQHRTLAALAVGLAGTVTLAACSGGSPATPGSTSSSYVSGGTFTVALNDDPGNLSPLTGVSLVQRALVPYAYESLVYTTEDGQFLPWLAASWTQTSTSITYTLKDGITCSDGTAFTAQTAANNIVYQADPTHGTFWFGSNITSDMSATAEGSTLTITSATTNPFLLASTGTVELVCQAGLDDPDTLADTTDGTGLFALTTSTPGSEYTYTKRTGYTWGPDGVTSDTVGLPDTIVGKVITDESTAANLLLAGDLNAAGIAGADRDRLDAAGLTAKGVPNPIGEMLFNERSSRPTADVRVRQALTLGLDRAAVAELVTNGHPIEMKSLVVQTPLVCVGTGPEWTLPAMDTTAAAQLLDQAGYLVGADGRRAKDGTPLTIRFLYDAGTPSHAAAAEEVQAEWNELGITTDLVAEDPTGWAKDIYQTYDWDTGFIQLDPGTPVVLSLFYLGATVENGGYNLQAADNEAYDTLAQQAMTAPDADTACGLWRDAEKELIDRVDAYPLAQALSPVFFAGATADLPGSIMPTSIRMLG